MRSLRFDGKLYLNINEPDPIPQADEALIRLHLAGICHTDLELTRGYMGFNGILGHEFIGELVADAGEFKAKQRVVGEINIACTQCDMCRLGIPSQCRQRSTVGIMNYPGVFADLIRLPVRNLHAVPDSVSDEEAVFVEPLAAALQITQQVQIRSTDRVILLGAGKLGLLCAQVLRLTGCDLTVFARQKRPIELLQQWNIPYLDLRITPSEKINLHQADVVVDCTGSAEGFARSLDLLRPRGTLVLKSTYADLPQADLTRVVIDEIRIVGSRCGPFESALRLLQRKLVDVTSMIERCYPLDESLTAFQYASRSGILKVLLRR